MSSCVTCFGMVVPQLDMVLGVLQNDNTSQSDQFQDSTQKHTYSIASYTSISTLGNFFIKKSCSDLTVKVSATNDIYKVHKLVLAMTSSKFEKMLIGNECGEIVLDDDPDSIRWIMLHAYIGFTRIPKKVSDVVDLYLALRKYEMYKMSSLCVSYLSCCINKENVDLVFNMALDFKETSLELKCQKVIEENAEYILKLASDTGNVSDATVIYLLQMEELPLTEIQLFEIILSWCKHRTELVKYNGKEAALRDYLEDILHLIDFLSMKPEDIIKTVATSEIFTNEEIVAILLTANIISKGSNERPLDRTSREAELHPSYPPYLRKITGFRRLNFPKNLVRKCQISMYMKCDYMSKWLPSGSYEIMMIQVSDTINLSQVKVRGDCFLGENHLDVIDINQTKGTSSSVGPPWTFLPPTVLRKNESYLLIVTSKGKSIKHEFNVFSIAHNGIEFCGQSIVCDISLSYFK